MPLYALRKVLRNSYGKEIKNNWIFYPIDEIKSNLTLRRKFKSEYGIDEDSINTIFNRTKKKLKVS